MPALHAALHDDDLVLWGDGVDGAVWATIALDVRVPSDAGWIVRETRAIRVTARDAASTLGGIPDADPSVAGLAAAVRAAAAIVLRQEYLPTLVPSDGDGHGDGSVAHARWEAVPAPEVQAQLEDLARALPGSVFATVGGRGEHLPREQVVARFVDRVVDALVREALDGAPLGGAGFGASTVVHDRWLAALTRTDGDIVDAPAEVLDGLAADISQWQAPARRTRDAPVRLCMRLEEPTDPTADADDPEGARWYLRYLVQGRHDPSTFIDAETAWSPMGDDAATLRRLGFHTGEHLLAPLAEAARLLEPIAESLDAARPAGCELTTAQAHEFLADVVPQLDALGVGAFVPAWWRGRGGRFQLAARAVVHSGLDGGRRSLDSLNLRTLVGYDWRVAVGSDVELTREELTELAAQRSSLVQVRGRWIEVDQAELRAAIDHLDRFRADPLTPSRGHATATVGELVALSLTAASSGIGLPAAGIDLREIDAADPRDARDLLLGLQREGELPDLPLPAGLRAELRPYQQRGFSWLAAMGELGLGACLADDMGLGKTLQALAAIAHDHETCPVAERGPSLIVCPTSVLTNWQRECERFVPDLPVLVHHGPNRARGEALAHAVAQHAVVITSYGLLARDADELASIAWRTALLDEAQNIKNPATRPAVAARALLARARVALTGTPVENHVGDLWSIMQFLVPGLLGSRADFRRRYLLPIQTGALPEVRAQLRRLVAPFVLRREKTDRSVISDLPDKFETVATCTITTEQAALYEAIVRDAERTLRSRRAPAGVERRGLILATISKLKQVCNHPVQLLGDNSQIAGRSGKLARLEGLLEQVLDVGERALVFTQFVTMGELLQRRLTEAFDREVLFLHGGTSRARRDAIVERFQSPDADAPPILVLSLKAGGSGLNLTAANHVLHYDRWWNPATEEQATDRAFRIGQTRDVQVHALVCAGTIEERIDSLLRQKRSVATAVVGGSGSGEGWIGELGDDELHSLLELRAETLLQPGRLDDIDPKEWKHVSL